MPLTKYVSRVLGRLHEVLDELEKGRLRPVDVLEEDEERPRPGQRFEHFPRTPLELLAGELGRREPDRRCHARLGLGVAGERRELLERDFGRVALDDPGGLSNCLCQRPKGDPFAVGKAAAAKEGHISLDRAYELVDEPRLPDAGLADHGDEPTLLRRCRLGQALTEFLELVIPPDHWCVEAARALDEIAHEAVGEVAQENLLLSGGLFETGGDVHGVAGDESLTGGRVAGDDLTRVHAGANCEADAPVTF